MICTFLYVNSSIQIAGELFVSCVHLTFVHFALQPAPPTKIYRRSKQLHLGNHSELCRCSYELFFLTVTDTITSQNPYLSSWIALPRARRTGSGRSYPLSNRRAGHSFIRWTGEWLSSCIACVWRKTNAIAPTQNETVINELSITA
jgi:hypothetical protein